MDWKLLKVKCVCVCVHAYEGGREEGEWLQVMRKMEMCSLTISDVILHCCLPSDVPSPPSCTYPLLTHTLVVH